MRLLKTIAPANTQFDALFTDGSIGKRHTRHELAIIEGKHRDMKVIIADKTGFDGLGFDYEVGGQDDNFHVVNVFSGQGSRSKYIDTVAVAGAMDIDHAVNLAVNLFDSMEASYGVFIPNEPEKAVMGFDGLSTDELRSLAFSADTLQKTLSQDCQNKHFLPIMTQKQLLTAQSQITHEPVMWDNAYRLLSHGGDDSQLLIDLQKNDTFKELTTKYTMLDALADMDIAELGFDALMDTNNRLQLMADRLFSAMSKASVDGISTTNVTLSKPFKRQGVANVAMQFDLSDGQTISIFFHNPDADPKKLSAQDVMVSWKWLLNKRDITAAVSPKQGDNVKLPQLAMRMMRIAAKNSKRFATAQATKEKNNQALIDAEADVAQKQATLDQLNADIASLTQKIDEATPKKGKWYENQPDNVSVYLIGNSKGNDYLKITDNTAGTGFDYTALINIGGVGGDFKGNLTRLKVWVTARTQKMGGERYALNHVAGRDILKDTSLETTETNSQSTTDTTTELSIMADAYGYSSFDEMPSGLGKTARKLVNYILALDTKNVADILHSSNKLSRNAVNALAEDLPKIPKTIKGTEEWVINNIATLKGILLSKKMTAVEYSPNNPYAQYANDDPEVKKNADDWESRKPLTEQRLADMNALAESMGYVTYIESRHANMGVFQAEKEAGNRHVSIDGRFINNDADSAKEAARDFTLQMQENGEPEDYFYTNDLEEALKKGSDWLEEATPSQEQVKEDSNVAENAHPNYTQDDIDYLNSIINGDIDPLDADMDKIIAIGEKDEIDPLFEQALAIINDAEDKATAGV